MLFFSCYETVFNNFTVLKQDLFKIFLCLKKPKNLKVWLSAHIQATVMAFRNIKIVNINEHSKSSFNVMTNSSLVLFKAKLCRFSLSDIS